LEQQSRLIIACLDERGAWLEAGPAPPYLSGFSIDRRQPHGLYSLSVAHQNLVVQVA